MSHQITLCATTPPKSSTIHRGPASRRFTCTTRHKGRGDVSGTPVLMLNIRNNTTLHEASRINPGFADQFHTNERSETLGAIGCCSTCIGHGENLQEPADGGLHSSRGRHNVEKRCRTEIRWTRSTIAITRHWISQRSFQWSGTSLLHLYSAMVEDCLTHCETWHGPNSHTPTDEPTGRRMHVYAWTDKDHLALRLGTCTWPKEDTQGLLQDASIGSNISVLWVSSWMWPKLWCPIGTTWTWPSGLATQSALVTDPQHVKHSTF